MNTIFIFKEVTSTMDISHILAQKNHFYKAIVVADIQTSGRGRLGRKWVSPSGGLWFSIILPPNNNLINNLGFLGILVSSSICLSLEKFLKVKLSFKWPNDIELGGKKIAGILFENVFEKDLKFIICGVGINLLVNPEEFDYYNLNATSLKDYLYLRNKKIILLEIIKSIYRNLERFPQNWKEIFKYYKDRFSYIGHVMINKKTNNILRIIELTEDGNILVEENGEIKKYNWGGISLEA